MDAHKHLKNTGVVFTVQGLFVFNPTVELQTVAPTSGISATQEMIFKRIPKQKILVSSLEQQLLCD